MIVYVQYEYRYWALLFRDTRIQRHRRHPCALVLVIKATSNSRKAPFLALLVPLFQPDAGADGIGHLAQRLALVFVALVGADQPLVVAIPAVQCLVLRWEAFVVWCRSDIGNSVQPGHLLLVELGRFRCEDLRNRGQGERLLVTTAFITRSRHNGTSYLANFRRRHVGKGCTVH